MKGQGLKAVVEGVKFILRMAVLVGIPAVLAEVAKQRPQWGVVIGTVLAFIDKVIHKLPNQYNGLLGF